MWPVFSPSAPIPTPRSGFRLNRLAGRAVLVVEFFLREVAVVFRELRHEMRGQDAQIPHGHLVVRVRPAGGVGKGGVPHPEFRRHVVHGAGEGVFGPGQAFGHHDRGVISGGDDDALDQFLGRRAVKFVEEHGGAAHVLGLGGHREFLVHAHAPVAERVEQHVERHELRHGRGRQGFVGVLFEEHRVVRDVVDIGGGRPGLERGVRRPGEGGECEDKDAEEGHGTSSGCKRGRFRRDRGKARHGQRGADREGCCRSRGLQETVLRFSWLRNRRPRSPGSGQSRGLSGVPRHSWRGRR